MVRALKHAICFLCLFVVFTSCKKDAVSNVLSKSTTSVNDLVETEPPVQVPISIRVNDAMGGFYSAVPFHYNETTKNYPLLIFFPGAGQLGNGTTDLHYVLNDGVPHLIDLKKFPANFSVNGSNFSFIVLSPQLSKYPSDAEVLSFIRYAQATYRVDSTRIYMSGLSMGGFVTSNFAADYPALLGAIVPMSGELTTGDPRCENIANARLPVWVFHNNEDPSINSMQATSFVEAIDSFNPAIPPRLTIFTATVHDAWTRATDPTYKEDNMNMYEWMLHYTR